MRNIARKAKEQRGIPGRVRDLVAQFLNVSNSSIAKYDSILNNLTPALMDEIKADKLSISVAYELSTLAADKQQTCYEYYLNHGKLPDKPSQSDVFQRNTQPAAAQSNESAQPDVLRRNTQPVTTQPSEPDQSDVFHRNTQPAAAQPDESAQANVFHRNTQPQAVQSDTAQYQIEVCPARISTVLGVSSMA